MIKRIALVLLCGIAAVAPEVYADPLPHIWSRSYGDPQSEQSRRIAVDDDGNVYIAGIFRGQIDLGGGVLTSAGGYDIFLAKFAPDGSHLWSRCFGDGQHQYVNGLAVNTLGQPVITGPFYGSVNFGGGAHVSAGGTDIYVAKFHVNGAFYWSRSYGDAADQWATSLGVDSSGMVTVTGYFAGTVDFGGGPLTSAGGNDIFLFKLDSSGGAHLWSERFGDASDQFAYALASDLQGRIALTGRIDGSVNFGGGTLTSAGGGDLFIAVFQAWGAHDWSRLFGDLGLQEGFDIAFDVSSDDVVATGIFTGTINLGGGSLVSAGGVDIFLARYTSAGSHEWSRRFGSTGADYGRGVAVRPWGEIALTGNFEGTVDFGGGALTSAGDSDLFIAAYAATGEHLYSQRAGDATRQEGQAVACSDDGDVLACGHFEGTIDLGGGPLTSNGGLDIYMAKLGPLASGIEAEGDSPWPELRVEPNPARGMVAIRYHVQTPGPVRLAVYDAGGRLIDVLVDQEMPAGNHAASWRHQGRSRAAGTGIYLVRLRTSEGSKAGKIMILD